MDSIPESIFYMKNLIQYIAHASCSKLLRYEIHIFVDKDGCVLRSDSIFFLHLCGSIIIDFDDKRIGRYRS